MKIKEKKTLTTIESTKQTGSRQRDDFSNDKIH